MSVDATPEDIRHFAKDWGGKVVRVLHLTPLSDRPPYAVDENVLNKMFRTTSVALENGLAVVFAPGVAMKDNDGFFSNPMYRSAFAGFWKRVAEHFKSDKRIIAYDLMNEPHGALAKAQWSDYARELTHAIREIDKDHTLIVEAPEWSWPAGFEFLKPTEDTNTVYSFHSYAPNEFTVQKGALGFLSATNAQWEKRVYPGSVMEGEVWNKATMEKHLEPVFEFSRRYHVPIWCGEFGTARWAKGALQWMRDMISILEDHHVGWAYYSYREWRVMDLEMSPTVKNQRTDRSETALVKLLKNAYLRGDTE